MAGYIAKKKLIKNELYQNLFDDYIFYLVIGIIIGGRLGYVFIYNIAYYLNNPFKIFILWEGGMSFHGALIGIVIATYLFSLKKNISSFYLLDLVAVSAPIGIFFGRMSNFINSELYGRETDVFWSVKFLLIDSINRHPSQIYEAILEGLLLFIILNFFISTKNKKDGYLSSMFLIFYSIFRFFVEFTRQPDEHVGLLIFNLSMGQMISILTLAIGMILWQFKRNV